MQLQNITLNKLRLFIGVANEGQFRRAADVLGVSRPTLSTQIRELEEACGAVLLSRTTRQVRLTAEGETLLRHARRIVDDLNAAATELSERAKLIRGHVVVAGTPSVAANVLPAAIAAFSARSPGIAIEIIEDGAAEVVRLVQSGQVDFGVCPRPYRAGDIIFSPLLRDRYVAVVGIRHPLAKQKRVKLNSLFDYPLLTMEHGTDIRGTLEHLLRGQRNIGVASGHKLKQTQTIVAMVSAGLGVSLLPALTLSGLDLRKTRTLTLVETDVWREIGTLRRQGGDTSHAAREFLETLSRLHMAKGGMSP